MFALYSFSVGWTALSFGLLSAGVVWVHGAQLRYFLSMGVLDLVAAVFVALLGMAATVSLLLLRRIAVPLFAVQLALNLFVVVTPNWLRAALSAPGLMVGAIFGWLTLLAFLLYARSLAKRGVLT